MKFCSTTLRAAIYNIEKPYLNSMILCICITLILSKISFHTVDGLNKIDYQMVFRVLIHTLPSNVNYYLDDFCIEMTGSWEIKQISSCNNATIMIDKDMKDIVIYSGSLKGGSNQGSEDH